MFFLDSDSTLDLHDVRTGNYSNHVLTVLDPESGSIGQTKPRHSYAGLDSTQVRLLHPGPSPVGARCSLPSTGVDARTHNPMFYSPIDVRHPSYVNAGLDLCRSDQGRNSFESEHSDHVNTFCRENSTQCDQRESFKVADSSHRRQSFLGVDPNQVNPNSMYNGPDSSHCDQRRSFLVPDSNSCDPRGIFYKLDSSPKDFLGYVGAFDPRYTYSGLAPHPTDPRALYRTGPAQYYSPLSSPLPLEVLPLKFKHQDHNPNKYQNIDSSVAFCIENTLQNIPTNFPTTNLDSKRNVHPELVNLDPSDVTCHVQDESQAEPKVNRSKRMQCIMTEV